MSFQKTRSDKPRAKRSSLALRAYRSMKRTRARGPVIAQGASTFRLRVGRSSIQGFGVFAQEIIPARRNVIEYTGVRFPRHEMRKLVREILSRGGDPPRYLLRLGRYWCLDGEIDGSGAQYVNHSCDPNLLAHKASDRIFLFSRRRIRSGEELTLDYRLRRTIPLIPCHCCSPKCRGTINLKHLRRKQFQGVTGSLKPAGPA